MTEYTEKCPVNLAASPVGVIEMLHLAASQWIAKQSLKFTIRRERAQLLQLSAAMLQDIGIDRLAAEHEAGRTDIPVERLR